MVDEFSVKPRGLSVRENDSQHRQGIKLRGTQSGHVIAGINGGQDGQWIRQPFDFLRGLLRLLQIGQLGMGLVAEVTKVLLDFLQCLPIITRISREYQRRIAGSVIGLMKLCRVL